MILLWVDISPLASGSSSGARTAAEERNSHLVYILCENFVLVHEVSKRNYAMFVLATLVL